jgi:hypothetical protein
MRNSSRIILSGLFATLLSCTATSPAEQTRRDGNWWVTRTDLAKASHVVGMFDGVELGRYFVMRNIRSQADADKLNEAFNSFMNNRQQLLSNVTVGQVQAGLDDFYQDYKNRKIYCSDAVEVVLEGSAGMPKDQLEMWIQKLRELASKS